MTQPNTTIMKHYLDADIKFYEGASQLHIRDGKKKRYINLRKIKKNHGPLWQSHINNKEQKINFQKTL